MVELLARDLHLASHGVTRLAGASVRLVPGELVVLLGPNGAGKTSLLRAALGLQRIDAGTALLGARPVAALPAMERARLVGYLPQARSLAWPQPVRDIVALGRFAHGGGPGWLSRTDALMVDAAIAETGLEELAPRPADTLSGGELARVHLARALAAGAPLLVADEPVAALDPLHQHRVLALMRRFVGRGGGVLAVLHDLALAARYADRLVWMTDGRTIAEGSVAETCSPEMIAQVYGISARVIRATDGIEVTIDGPLPGRG